MSVRITFLGAAGTVTGAKFLVEHGNDRVMVDCGLFQGYKQLRLRNWADLPVDPASVRAVCLTHAHLDHSGYLPLLARQGFRGPVWATPGTRDLCEILLPDSGHIQEEDAAFANRHGYSKHRPALPLYTVEDARHSLRQIRVAPSGQAFEPVPGWRARFQRAGHILGASSLLLEVGGQRLLFSGDLGRPDDPIMLPPEPPPAADVVVVESTYGNREHPPQDLLSELAPLLSDAAARGGTVVMPVFAVGRSQVLLHAIAQLKQQGRLPAALPVFLDSPMAIHSTELFARHLGEHRLDAAQCRDMAHAAQMTRTPAESKAIAAHRGPKLILAASGMATGGRVLHHLVQQLGDHRNLILLTGYQVPGTRGATLASGAATVRIHGQDVAVRAQVAQLQAASAHADGTQTLQWLRALPGAPRQVYVVHGEMEAADRLRQRVEADLRWQALVPEHGAAHRL